MKNELLVASYEILRWTRDNVRLSEPHQELQPWCSWFRPVQHRHLAWLIAWPEEDHLHP